MLRTTILAVFCISLTFQSCSSSEKEGKQRDTAITTPDNRENRVSPAETTTADFDGNVVTINYGSPKVKDREIWGALVPYGEVWRTGANEATTITFTKDVLIDGQLLKAGTYAFFTIPDPEAWTIIFNLEEKQWGAFKYDSTQDALRLQVEPVMQEELTEALAFTLEKAANGGVIQLRWEKIAIDIPFTTAPE